MERRFRFTTMIATLIVIGLALFVLIGCPQAMLANMQGTWTGTWTETTYSGSGAMSVTITVDGSDVTATGTIDLTALGHGTPTGTATGTISGTSLDFTFSSPSISGTGTGMVVISDISGGGTMSPYGDFTYTASVDGNTITGTYDFPGGGAGEVTLERQ